MTKPKHTPGPWKTTPHNKDREGSIYAMQAVESRPSLSLPKCIAVAPALETPEQWEVNARLIASAPELLKACISLVKDKCRGCGIPFEPDFTPKACAGCVSDDAQKIIERIEP